MRKHPILEIEDVVEPVMKRRSIPLSDYDPEVAESWCDRLNCGFMPEQFSHGSGVRAWWICRFCEREYKAQIYNRTCLHSGCPYCSSKRVCIENAFSILFPFVAREWDPIKNGKVQAADVTHGANKVVWWLCGACQHSWETSISARTNLGSGCPKCYELRMKEARERPRVRKRGHVILNDSGKPVSRLWYEKWDFVPITESDPKVAAQWHPTKNGHLTPNDYPHGSEARAWWLCPKGPDHEWDAPIYSRTGAKGHGCPFCAGKRVSITNSLESLFPAIAAQWHPKLNGKLRPSEVTAHVSKSVWWLCNCGHEWQSAVKNRTKRLSGCPSCKAKPTD